MLYNGSDVVRDLEWVIFDEVHYVNDPEVKDVESSRFYNFAAQNNAYAKLSVNSCYLYGNLTYNGSIGVLVV